MHRTRLPTPSKNPWSPGHGGVDKKSPMTNFKTHTNFPKTVDMSVGETIGQSSLSHVGPVYHELVCFMRLYGVKCHLTQCIMQPRMHRTQFRSPINHYAKDFFFGIVFVNGVYPLVLNPQDWRHVHSNDH